jgi:hypothetical protein
MFHLISRFRRSVAATAGLALALSATATLWAQNTPLADVARKEQERRKALPPAGKVYTNKDLPNAPPRPAEATPPQSAAAPAEPSTAIPAEGQDPSRPAAGGDADQKSGKGDEGTWRKRITDAREEVRRNEMFASALQTRINSLTNDVLSRSDYAQKARLAGDRKEAQAELARVKQEIERGKKQIADIEEEARKAGVPPGWLR